MIKKLFLVLTLVILNHCFSQNTKGEPNLDSVFNVKPNLIYGNNYYLLYAIGPPNFWQTNLKDLPFPGMGGFYLFQDLNWHKVILLPFWIQNASRHKKNNEYKKHEELTLTWDDVDFTKIQLNSNESLIFERTNNIPNGKFNYIMKNDGLIRANITGNFKNGLAIGSWDKFETEKKNNIITKTHSHQNYLNGMPDGEWFTEKDGVKIISSSFSNGKAHGKWLITRYEGKNEIKQEIEYKDGFLDGPYRMYYDSQLISSGEFVKGLRDGTFVQYCIKSNKNCKNDILGQENYSMGKRYGTSNFYSIKEDFLYKIKYDDTSEVVLSIHGKNNELLLLATFSDKLGEIMLRNGFRGSCFRGHEYILHNFSCNSKIISYHQNGKIKKIEFFGTEEFKQGKKIIGFFENGQIKFEGTYGGSILYYNMEGKLVDNSLFSKETTYWDDKIWGFGFVKTRIEIPFFMGQN